MNSVLSSVCFLSILPSLDSILFFNNKYYNCFKENLIYEREYLKENRNGKGKGFFLNDFISYEDEYLNGKKMGKGKNIITMVIWYTKANI